MVCVTLYILPLLKGGMLRAATCISYDECLSQTLCELIFIVFNFYFFIVVPCIFGNIKILSTNKRTLLLHT